jgi:hypothetical protein
MPRTLPNHITSAQTMLGTAQLEAGSREYVRAGAERMNKDIERTCNADIRLRREFFSPVNVRKSCEFSV